MTHCQPDSEVLRLFIQLSALCSVTGSENRAYGWLLKEHWISIAKSFDVERSRSSNRAGGQLLDANFVGGLQLAVNWTGNPSSNRRLIMIAHCDTEGYIIDQCVDVNGELRLTGWHPNPQRKAVNDFRTNTPVRIAVGRGGVPEIFEGILERVNSRLNAAGEVSPEVTNGAVCITVRNLDEPSRKKILDATMNEEFGTVSAIHSFDLRVNEDVLEAPYVDNVAGVAVCTSVLSECIKRRDKVNASILFTFGEEAGFAGLLHLIGSGSLGGNSDYKNVVFVVVDSSDYTRSHWRRLDEWRETIRTHRPTSGRKTLCWDTMATVRLGDAKCDFNLSVTRFLYQAALQARVDTQSGILADPKLLAGIKEQIGLMGVAGVFEGGLCEAGICAHASELARLLGATTTPSMPAGSIAIPLANFRAIDPMSAQFQGNNASHQPERTRLSALNSACQILRAACELNMSYSYPSMNGSAVEFGFRVPDAAERQKFLARWVQYSEKSPMDITQANRRWVREEGLDLASSIHAQTL